MTTPESTRPVGAADEAAVRRAAARTGKPAKEPAGRPQAEEPAEPQPAGWTLTKISGVLALVSVGSYALSWLLDIWQYDSRYRPPFLIASWVVVAVGGVLALAGKRALAPCLLLAGTGVILWNDPPMSVGLALSSILDKASLLGLLAAVVTAFVGMFRREPAPAPQHPTASGVAVLSPNGTVAAGWFADPDGKPSERYWDGEAWADLSRPMTAGSAALRSQSTIGRGSESVSTRSRTVAALLCFFVGIMGVHRFYAGKVGTGLLMLFTLGGLGIWVLVDFVWILSGTFKDKNGSTLVDW
jgi:hypothetical protein